MQDCLVDVVQALPKYRFEGSPLHYVTKIALRRAIASRRRGTARAQHLRLLEDLQEAPSLDDAVSGEREQSEAVRMLIAGACIPSSRRRWCCVSCSAFRSRRLPPSRMRRSTR